MLEYFQSLVAQMTGKKIDKNLVIFKNTIYVYYFALFK